MFTFQAGSDPSDLILLCQHLLTVCEVIQQHLKQIRRRVVESSPVLPLPAIDFSHCCSAASKITKVLRDVAKAALSQIAVTGGNFFNFNLFLNKFLNHIMHFSNFII